MQCLLILLTVAGALAQSSDLDEDWSKFKNAYKKVYADANEEAIRRLIFENHAEIIAKHNRDYDLGLSSYRLGLNAYADLSNFEFRNKMNGYRASRRSKTTSILKSDGNYFLPASVDWRKKGAVTPIKDQEQCGSCWAFSATGSMEGQHFLKTTKLVSLSEQNLVDCSIPQGNQGCEGGWMDDAFEYVIDNNGIDTEQSYPYKAMDGKCKFKKQSIGANISSFVDVQEGSESALQKGVALIGPVSVAIDASQISFQLYSDGVYDEPLCSTTQLDHGVLAIGYDTDQESGQDYWLVKNSWGTTWGIKGFIKMSRNKDNQCGIATAASYPVV